MKATNEEILALVEQGMSQKDIAARLGVSAAAVSQRLKRLNVAVNKDVALRSAQKIVDQNLDLRGELEGLIAQTKKFLELVNLSMDPKAEGHWEARDRLTKLLGKKGNTGDFLVKSQGELRKQLEAYFGWLNSIYSIQRVARFQEIVLGILANEAPETAARIRRRLAEEGMMMSALNAGGAQV